MNRTLALVACLAVTAASSAHFAYLIPTVDGSGVHVVFSDSLEADAKVPIAQIADTKLFRVEADGKRTPLKVSKVSHALAAEVRTGGNVVIGGVTNYGFHQSKHTQNKAVCLRYYPKAVFGDVEGAARLGDAVPLEIIPIVKEGKLRFQALLKGKPLAGAKFSVLEPGATKTQKSAASDEGQTTAFDKAGRYGVNVSHFEPSAGELDGKKYEEIRHYATLVVELKTTGK